MTTDGASRFLIYGVLVIVGLLGAISDALLNEWAQRRRMTWLLAAYAAWLVVATLLGVILRRGYFSFGAAIVLFLLVNSVAALALDVRFFGGRLNAWGWLGIGFALVAMACLELGRPHAAPGKVERADSEVARRPSTSEPEWPSLERVAGSLPVPCYIGDVAGGS